MTMQGIGLLDSESKRIRHTVGKVQAAGLTLELDRERARLDGEPLFNGDSPGREREAERDRNADA